MYDIIKIEDNRVKECKRIIKTDQLKKKIYKAKKCLRDISHATDIITHISIRYHL